MNELRDETKKIPEAIAEELSRGMMLVRDIPKANEKIAQEYSEIVVRGMLRAYDYLVGLSTGLR